jgi:hypothetical protein
VAPRAAAAVARRAPGEQWIGAGIAEGGGKGRDPPAGGAHSARGRVLEGESAGCARRRQQHRRDGVTRLPRPRRSGAHHPTAVRASRTRGSAV